MPPPAPLDVAFALDLAHGVCAGVRLPDDPAAVDDLARAALVAEERAFAAALPPKRRKTWVGGRAALRCALSRAGVDAPAVLPDGRGAPALPAGLAGSISHKDTLAVALVARGDPRVGVDVELDAAIGPEVAARVLTAEELRELAPLDEPGRLREARLRFSAKEAVYKAIDPFVRRYVAFHEVAVRPEAGGGARVALRLRPGERPLLVEVRWLRREGHLVTTARAAAIGPDPPSPAHPL